MRKGIGPPPQAALLVLLLLQLHFAQIMCLKTCSLNEHPPATPADLTLCCSHPSKRLKSSGSSMSTEDVNGLESGGENESDAFYNRTPSSSHASWAGTYFSVAN